MLHFIRARLFFIPSCTTSLILPSWYYISLYISLYMIYIYIYIYIHIYKCTFYLKHAHNRLAARSHLFPYRHVLIQTYSQFHCVLVELIFFFDVNDSRKVSFIYQKHFLDRNQYLLIYLIQ